MLFAGVWKEALPILRYTFLHKHKSNKTKPKMIKI